MFPFILTFTRPLHRSMLRYHRSRRRRWGHRNFELAKLEADQHNVKLCNNLFQEHQHKHLYVLYTYGLKNSIKVCTCNFSTDATCHKSHSTPSDVEAVLSSKNVTEIKNPDIQLKESDSVQIEDKNIHRTTWSASYDPETLKENIYGLKLYDDYAAAAAKQDEEPASKPIKKQQPKRKYKVLQDHDDTRIQQRNRSFARSLKSYIQVCGHAGMENRAHETLMHYRSKARMSPKRYGNIDINIYNELLNCWAKVGNLDNLKEVFLFMEEDSVAANLQSYAAKLECLARNKDTIDIQPEIDEISSILRIEGKELSDILKECKFTYDQFQKVYDILEPVTSISRTVDPRDCHVPYNCNLLVSLNKDSNQSNSAMEPYIKSCIKKEDIESITQGQIQLENNYFIDVKSVVAKADVSPKAKYMRQCVKDCEERFRKDILNILDNRLQNMFEDIKGKRCMTLFPYLCVIHKDIFVNQMLQEVRFLAESAEYYSQHSKVLYHELGIKIMNHYFIWLRKKNKVTDKVAFLVKKYCEYLLTPGLASKYTPREYWGYLKHLHFHGATIDAMDCIWPYYVLHEVGKFLYDILIDGLLFDVNKVLKYKKPSLIHPFYMIYERTEKGTSGPKYKEALQIRAHTKLCHLYREAELDQMQFDVSMVPTLCPPRPWTTPRAGGLVMTPTTFVRLPFNAQQYTEIYDDVPNEKLYPCLDSLNILSLCPWIINKPMLDLIIDVFRNNGCEELDIPINPATLLQPRKLKKNMTDEEKKQIRREKFLLKKKEMETTSLWYDCLYKLSIANYYRDKIFWFPHNIDFRGRVYPTPPHFNHLGSDLVRSILLFAESRPLGPVGLNWLKIHLINLTGFKKREPLHERLRYANEVMPEILDSADAPFTGNQWWRKADEPWQALACCKEIAQVVRSPNPEKYMSHFPVHQDGSCNGLQHYAALGRDELGAKEVNLHPADSPEDVYSGVAALVEEARRKDAAEGNKTAIMLKGFVRRKVVKQTVMTIVYGVTQYGAWKQIQRQLEDIKDFPQQHCRSASLYLMKHTFASIQKMFTATREIQKWFTDCAEVITKIYEEPVEWITPVGLPVIQPYHKKTRIKQISDSEFLKGRCTVSYPSDNSYTSTTETYKLPNVRKQKNAFPPNFVHSLDSSHMMLTSLFCQRTGITFVSVHDCYWTHASTVDIMNKICREQFVALHNEPILENLSNFFLKMYTSKKNGNKLTDWQLEKLKSVLSSVPEKGSFKLEKVLNSVYFFS